MNLIRKVGADDISFGTSEALVSERLGQPLTIQQVPDCQEYPRGRRVLTYVQRDFLITPEQGVIAITVEAAESAIMLDGINISPMSPAELQAYIAKLGYAAELRNDAQWDDCEVEAMECGVIAWFCEGTLESIEVHNPAWRQRSR